MMKTLNRDTVGQYPAIIVYTVDASAETLDTDPIVFMREDSTDESTYDGLMIDRAFVVTTEVLA